MITIATVLKCGGDYTSYHVDVLRRSIDRHTSSEYNFVCLTDSYSNEFPTIKLEHGWPKWWAKMELFKLNGPVVYFDLDTVIVGSLEPLIEIAKRNNFSILRDVFQGEKKPNAMQSSVMTWNGDMRYLYESFKKDHEKIIATMHGDQTFITKNVNPKNVTFFQDIIPDNLLSFKAHVKQMGLTEKTSIVFFHGYPRPWEQNLIPYDNIQK